MTTFQYKALSKDGAPVNGVIEAYDEFEAVAQIKQTCNVVIKVEPIKMQQNLLAAINEPLNFSIKSLGMVCQQFSILLRAGLPIVQTTKLIADQTTDRLLHKLLAQAADDVAAGSSLATSFENSGKKIPAVFIETVRAGEEAGTLEGSFERLAKYFEKSDTIKKKVKGAMMYPMLLMVMAVVVTGIVMVFVVPTLMDSMSAFGGYMPLPTQLLMGISDFLVAYWWAVLIFFVVLFGLFKLYGNTEQGKRQYSKIGLSIPLIGRINQMNAASQFANTMATLLAAGLPIINALRATGRVLDSYVIGLSVDAAIVGVEEGKRVGDILRTNPYLPSLLVEMTAVGEQSGALESTLETIGQFYDNESNDAANKVLSMLEPMITVILGIVIGFVVIALYLPMFTMYGG